MKSKLKKITYLIIGLLIAFLPNNTLIFNNEAQTELSIPKQSAGYSESFIHVDGNWTQTTSKGWCYGDGSWVNPYVIENVTIDASTSPIGSGILINNSQNAYFIVRNCTIFNADDGFFDSGIWLENTYNGTLINNNCSSNNQGIYLINCERNNITENTANNNEYNGIYIETNCEYNNITRNSVNNNLYGIQLSINCSYNNIILNTVNDNDDYGIFINSFTIPCDNNIILNNTANENNRHGIYIRDDNNDNNVINNTVKDNIGTGVYLADCHDINVTGNTINNNKRGIYVQACDNSNITGNTINNNLEMGIYLFANSYNNEIKNNTINRNDLGIKLENSNDNNITGNALKDNAWCIYETSCEGNIIEYNDCSSPTVEFPIYIDDYATGVDAHNWTWAVSQSWCSGTGESWDPYIIENLNISGFGTESYGIDIRNSNVSFIIQECLIYNSANAGIYLENVNNSRLINNNCSNNRNGIYIQYGNNITILENTANGNIQGGIYAQEINFVNIIGNTLNDNDEGIDIGLCKSSYIIENIASGNIGNGIYLGESLNNTISGNSANVNYDGIYLEKADFNTIIDNTVNNNIRAGIYLRESEHNIISENFAVGNLNGVFLEDENYNNNITGNILSNNDCGIEIYESDFNSIKGNTANDNNVYGISLEYSNNNTISGNNAKNNTMFGIYLGEENSENNISRNSVNNNKNTGIYFEDDCDYNVITENTINKNNIGIYLHSNCGNNSIYENLFLENGKHAEDGGTDNKWNSTTIGNYWDNWTSPDVNPNDGIVDLPYNISGPTGSKDYLPIAEDGAPSITINSPIPSEVFAVTAPSFDVTITDIYLDESWYTIDGGINNYTFIENGIIDQTAWAAKTEGSVTITFYASDIFSNIGIAEVSVAKDTTAPILVINSPVEGETFGNTAPLFNITITEDNLDSIWYSFDGGLTNYTIINTGTFDQTAWTALPEGDVTITFYARDLAGNEVSETITVVKIIPAGGLDPGIIVIIVVVSIVGGVAIAVVIYIYLKKRASPK